MPKLLGEAVVATEDRRFYNHGAIDVWGIARATVVDLLHHGGREGASTITQQLARNSIGRMERTYNRKLLEIFFAHRIELAYTKDQILRYYLDRIYFGQGLYGAQTTAYAFFGVPASKLSLAQCALLAGMISSPNASSPWKDIKRGQGGARPLPGQDGARRLHHPGPGGPGAPHPAGAAGRGPTSAAASPPARCAGSSSRSSTTPKCSRAG